MFTALEKQKQEQKQIKPLNMLFWNKKKKKRWRGVGGEKQQK